MIEKLDLTQKIGGRAEGTVNPIMVGVLTLDGLQDLIDKINEVILVVNNLKEK